MRLRPCHLTRLSPEAHQQREQAVVFPMLLRGADALLNRTIDVMIAVDEGPDGAVARAGSTDRRLQGGRARLCRMAAALLLCFKLYADCREQVELENRILLAGSTAGIRDDTEASVAPAQRPSTRPFLEDGHDAKRIAPSFSEGLGRCSRNSSRSSSPARL